MYPWQKNNYPDYTCEKRNRFKSVQILFICPSVGRGVLGSDVQVFCRAFLLFACMVIRLLPGIGDRKAKINGLFWLVFVELMCISHSNHLNGNRVNEHSCIGGGLKLCCVQMNKDHFVWSCSTTDTSSYCYKDSSGCYSACSVFAFVVTRILNTHTCISEITSKKGKRKTKSLHQFWCTNYHPQHLD